MKLDKSRRSRNVEDRRGRGPSRGMVGGGIGALLVLVIASLIGIDPGALEGVIPSNEPATPYDPTTGDAEGEFVSIVLGETELTWNTIFQQSGGDYREPTLVMFTGAVQSACGFAQAAVGPFYCPADEKVYLDTSFFDDLSTRFGAPGDFARAYVIAHEVGHHVQNLIGISSEVHRLRSSVSQEQANQLSVLQELQADCFAGVWAHFAEQQRNILEEGDVQEGLGAASAVGDDRLQMQSQGYVVPESFTHGSSGQRQEWFARGYQTGSINDCDTFASLR